MTGEAQLVPNGNWLRMHRGWGEKPKKRHQTFLGAKWHAHQHRAAFRIDADNIWVYPCWFTDENGWGRKHYHIGHLPQSKKLLGPRPPLKAGTLYLGVFAVAGGFEVRVFESRPAECGPVEPTAEAAVKSWLSGRSGQLGSR
jgi:hypothetical protein